MSAETSGEHPPQERLRDYITSRTVEVSSDTAARYREGALALQNPYKADYVTAAVIAGEGGPTGYIALSRDTFDVYLIETPMTPTDQITVQRGDRTRRYAADSTHGRNAVDKLLDTLETMERDGTLVWED